MNKKIILIILIIGFFALAIKTEKITADVPVIPPDPYNPGHLCSSVDTSLTGNCNSIYVTGSNFIRSEGSQYPLQASTTLTNGRAVYGTCSSSGCYGVYGSSTNTGVYGYGNLYGIYGSSSSTYGLYTPQKTYSQQGIDMGSGSDKIEVYSENGDFIIVLPSGDEGVGG
ncbi:hypothetical protein K8R47_00830 [archaeon]|nr:hypothetical protein [archaeon]